MKNKGLDVAPSQILIFLIVIASLSLTLYLTIQKYFDIELTIDRNEFERRKILLAHILISSDKLAYSDETTVYRGVLEKTKLDKLVNDPSELFSEINYPDGIYFFRVDDIESSNTWKISEGGIPNDQNLNYFPVSIRYSEQEIHPGLLWIGVGRLE